MTIKHPPTLIPIDAISGADIAAHTHYMRVTDERGRYLPFDKFRYRAASDENVALAWTLTRRARNAALTHIDYSNAAGEQAGFFITPGIAATCELVDKHATRLALNEITHRLRGVGAALNPLQLDEPITSSQLEGANTTTIVARNMLESGRTPRNEDEQMIAGNARLMAELPELLQEPLTPDLIRRIHAVGMGGIDDEKYHPGDFRTTDDIVIMDYDNNIIHQPPAASSLPVRLQMVCDFVNGNGPYVHPLVKACILHFMIAHEHPFRDGNGRTSRGLFYWYMLKSGYDAFKFVSISQLLHNAPAKYAHSYQYAETDGMDLTYFLDYQANIIGRAMEQLLSHVDQLLNRAAVIDSMLFKSGALRRLSQRQVTLLNVMMDMPDKTFTVSEIAAAMGVSDNTARNDLRKLVGEGLAEEFAVNEQKTAYRISLNFTA
ncbi:Fic family protein [Photorhabdus tasmaniensis]|uniref:Fic family protein n=1 Tax=Photorhabdus tasmaniensis TaxID=1004159 RepID=UPI004041FECA